MLLDLIEKEQPPLTTIIKIKTDYFVTGDKLVRKSEIRTLKKKSTCDELDELISNISPEDAWFNIVNINDVRDGVYQLKVNNVSVDYETGIADDWDYILVPYEEEEV